MDTSDIVPLTGAFGDSVPTEAPPRYDISPDPPLPPPNAFIDTADIAKLTSLFGQGCSLAGGVLATFNVAGEAFKAWVTNPQTVQ